MKKITAALSVLLAVAMLLTLSSCGSKKGDNNKGNSGNSGNNTTTDAWYLGGGTLVNFDAKEFFKDKTDTVNPQSIYASTEITAEMLHGAYSLNNMDKDIKDIRKNGAFEDVAFYNGTYNISSLPIAICFGSENISTSLTKYKYGEYSGVTDVELAVLLFASADDIGQAICSYKVEGNQLIFTALKEADESGVEFAYEETDTVFTYNFSIAGPYITITKGADSIKLIAYAFSDNFDSDLWLAGYSKYDSPLIDELDYFSASEQTFYNYAVKRDGSYYDVSGVKLDGEGRITIYLKDGSLVGEETEFIEQYAYIVQSTGSNYFAKFSIILLDGNTEYYYTDDITVREARILKEQGIDISALTAEEIEEIANKRKDLFSELKKELEAQGIDADVNSSTGEIAVDAAVLFGGDSAELSDAGKESLDKFIAAYLQVVSQEKYVNFIAKTIVEGHTAPVAGSTYEGDLPLSTSRATNVRDYCLSITTEDGKSMDEAELEAKGVSISKPVYGADGEIDLDACRRVSFTLVVNVH